MKLQELAGYIGIQPKRFGVHLMQSCPDYAELPAKERAFLSMLLWGFSSRRYRHNRFEEFSPIYHNAKKTAFGSAKRFDEVNADLFWFQLEKSAIAGKSAEAWDLTANARELVRRYWEGEQGQVKGYEKGGGTARLSKYAISSSTAQRGTKTRFKGYKVSTLIEINGDSLRFFSKHVVKAWLDREPCPAGFEYAFARWEEVRDGTGPKSGQWEADKRSIYCKGYADGVADMAESSSAKGFMHPNQYTESRAGRLYADNAFNLQQSPSEVRRTALAGCYDVDIENCHWALLAQMAERIDLETPHIQHYLDNKREFRESVADAAGLSIDDAKFVLLASIYGATLARSAGDHRRAIADRIGNDAIGRLQAYEPIKELLGEVRGIRKAIIDDYAANTAKAGVLVNDAGREISLKVTDKELLAHILQGAESCALQVMMDYLGDDIKVLQHDGLTVVNYPDVEQLEAAILEVTGYRLALEVEQL